MLRTLALQALIAIATASSLLSCPIDKIVHATREPLGKYQKTEISALEFRSTEGGVWHVYRKRDGAAALACAYRLWRDRPIAETGLVRGQAHLWHRRHDPAI
jgi:hypothetical protein